MQRVITTSSADSLIQVPAIQLHIDRSFGSFERGICCFPKINALCRKNSGIISMSACQDAFYCPSTNMITATLQRTFRTVVTVSFSISHFLNLLLIGIAELIQHSRITIDLSSISLQEFEKFRRGKSSYYLAVLSCDFILIRDQINVQVTFNGQIISRSATYLESIHKPILDESSFPDLPKEVHRK